MRKVLSLAVLISGISFGMTDSVRDTYTKIAQQWQAYSDLHKKCRLAYFQNYKDKGMPVFAAFAAIEKECDAAKPKEFDKGILDLVIREEVGEDATAQQILQMFFDRKLYDVPYFYLANAASMTSENCEKFKELLLPLAPIINVGQPSLSPVGSEYRQHVDTIVSIWGSNAGAITPETIQHPQFCFEVLAKIIFDLDESSHEELYKSVDMIIGDLILKCNWPDKKSEITTYLFARGGLASPEFEEENGICYMLDVWPNWDK
jgi:hypothetical protein